MSKVFIYRDGRMSTAEVLEEVDWFLWCGVDPELTAKQLGRSCASIARNAQVAGRHDIARIFSTIDARQRRATA
jgi:hypothetical protein